MQVDAGVNSVETYGWILLGVLVSLTLPILRQWAFPPAASGAKAMIVGRLWQVAKPYVLIGLLSAVLALVTLAIAKSQGAKLAFWYQAFLLGYFFDSTIQKFKP